MIWLRTAWRCNHWGARSSLAWLGAIAALLFAACAPAQTVQPQSAKPAPQRAAPAQWRLADDDNTITLFGTVHMLPPDFAWERSALEAALEQAEAVYLETNIDPEGQAALPAAMLRAGTNPPGVTLSGLLSAADRARLQTLAASLGVSVAALEDRRPWLAALSLSVAAVARAGHDPEAGADAWLRRRAQALGAELRYLETAEEQIAVFAGLSPQADRAFLTATLRQVEEDIAELGVLDRAWAAGDLATLEPMLVASLSEAGPEVYAAALTNRNVRWVEAIEALIAGDEDVVIGVGTAHLVGPDSVVAMLRAKGYAVEGPGAPTPERR